jgi:hypothetical protein
MFAQGSDAEEWQNPSLSSRGAGRFSAYSFDEASGLLGGDEPEATIAAGNEP